jgi:predicted HTH transcriptional regulator
VAATNVQEDDVVMLLDYTRYYEKLELPIPRNRDKVLEDLENEKFIKKNDAGKWNITNLGALMIAKDLKKFEMLVKRTIRIIWYQNDSRLEAVREKEFSAGYVMCYEDIIDYIMTVIPQKEEILDGIRKNIYSFPEIAIRELLANIMIHQALEQRGTNPMIEIFSDRIEFSNAGAPLIDINRIVDTVPVSRNENIAGFMHKCGICEERGSGYDKIIASTSKNTMLAPKVENQGNQFTKVILFAKIPFDLTTKEDRIRTCYMKACFEYVNFRTITNSDIRILFGLDDNDKVKSSRIIKDTIEAGLIKPVDPDTAPRYMKYIPHWA